MTRIDTHAAAVFLAGPHAFKIKRNVRFPFLDFPSVSKRKAACEAELSVNPPSRLHCIGACCRSRVKLTGDS